MYLFINIFYYIQTYSHQILIRVTYLQIHTNHIISIGYDRYLIVLNAISLTVGKTRLRILDSANISRHRIIIMIENLTKLSIGNLFS